MHVSVGVTAAIATGTHREQAGATRVPLLPLPLVTLRVPLKRFEIFAEGMPPIGPVTYRSLYDRTQQSTLLSYAHASVRYRFSRYDYAGVGETIYNQRTTYVQKAVSYGLLYSSGAAAPEPFTITSYRKETDASRVPGMRFEVGGRWPAGAHSTVSAELAVTPAMHALIVARQRAWTTTSPKIPFPFPVLLPGGPGATIGETGSEVDAAVTAARTFGPLTLRYGVRYLNYIAHFNGSGALADRNTLVLPFIGFERAFGR